MASKTFFQLCFCGALIALVPCVSGCGTDDSGPAGSGNGNAGEGGNAAGDGGTSGTSGNSGSSGSTGTGGASGNANGGSGNAGSGTGGSGQGDDCPDTAPANATACTEYRTLCQYDQRQCVCEQSEEWTCATTVCPASVPADGVACDAMETRQCRYGMTLCTCGGERWGCEVGCPPAPPEPQGDCPELDAFCAYPPGLVCTCSASGWSCGS